MGRNGAGSKQAALDILVCSRFSPAAAPFQLATSHSAHTLQGYFVYHLFGLLWTNQVIVGFGYLVIAHCIGQYYWNRGIRSDMSSFPVLTGIRTAGRYCDDPNILNLNQHSLMSVPTD